MLLINAKNNVNDNSLNLNTIEDFNRIYLESDWKKVLYIHIPFCPQKCKYCICKSSTGTQEMVISFVENELLLQVKEAYELLNTVKFDEVYIGGGTPTFVPASILRKIFDTIPNFKDIPKKCIEGSPNTIALEHIELFKEYNFSFISIGIQSLNKDICSWQNRFWISEQQAISMSDILRGSGIYFNYDLICYMGKGDFRDIPAFEHDLDFLMDKCKPSSINIHQMHQTEYTSEKMIKLMEIIRNSIAKHKDYECINSNLNDDDVFNDIVFQSQYRLVREKRDFTHYMWNKYPEIPVLGYDIYSIGYTEKISPNSNAGDIVYRPGRNTFKKVQFNDKLYSEYRAIRQEKGLD